MRESGRHMKVMEKTQKRKLGEGDKSCLRSGIISMHRRLSFPTVFLNAGMVISFLNRLINHCAFRMTVLRCFTIKPKS